MIEIKNKIISLNKTKLFSDIDKLIYLYAKGVSGDEMQLDKYSSDVEDAVDGIVMHNIADEKVAYLKKILTLFLVDDETSVVSNIQDISDTYEFNFVVPVTLREAKFTIIFNLINKYITNGVAYEWLKIHNIHTQDALLENELRRTENELISTLRENVIVKHSSPILYHNYKVR